MIPEHIIDDVRAAADIVEVIGDYVKLRKRGKNFIGLCPFHREKTPSFNVNPTLKIFKCFGCGKGGNVFTFMMEVDRVSFIEAVKNLAERYNVRLPDDRREQAEAKSDFDRMFAALRFAGNFYYTHLHSNDRNATHIREEYLKKQRGLTDATIRAYGLGASPNGWDVFFRAAQEEGFTGEELEHAGLVKARSDGGYYDAFRNRAMFPFVNTAGRVVGFGARKVFDDDTLAKYINSPESAVYVKNRILYGLWQAKDEIRRFDRAYLVEGYMDVISLHQHGVKNVVASSGTSLTEGQVELLSRYTTNVVLVYDADAAGLAAASRGIDVMVEQGLHVRVLALPTGDDPDTFVRAHGGEAFDEAANKAMTLVEFRAMLMQKAGQFDTPELLASSIHDLVATVAKIPDAIERTLTLRAVGEKFDLYETDLQRELDKVMRPTRAHHGAPPPREEQDEPHPLHDEPVSPVENDLLRAIVRGGRPVADYVFERIRPDAFRHPVARHLAEVLEEEVSEKGKIDYEHLVEHVEDAGVRELLVALPFDAYHPSVKWEELSRPNEGADLMRLARDCVSAIRREVLERERRELQQQLATVQDATAVMQRIVAIDRTLRELKIEN